MFHGLTRLKLYQTYAPLGGGSLDLCPPPLPSYSSCSLLAKCWYHGTVYSRNYVYLSFRKIGPRNLVRYLIFQENFVYQDSYLEDN